MLQQKRTFNEAMDHLHASDDLYERAIAQAHGGHRMHRGKAKPLAAVMAGALALIIATGGTVYAAGHVDVVKPLLETFFSATMGDHGMGDASSWDVEGGRAWTREYDAIDPSTLDDQLTQAVQPVNLSVEAFGTTLTIHDMVIDENACGMARFTVSNPNGIKLAPYGMPNELILDGQSEYFSPGIGGMEDSAGNLLDTRCFYDSNTLTDVSVDGTMYFTPISGELEQAQRPIFEGVTWSLSWNDPKLKGTDFVFTDQFVPSKAIKTRTFTDGGKASASLSPFGICYVADCTDSSEFVDDRLVVRYADGSTETIIDYMSDTTVDNAYVRAMLGKHNVSVFTKIVDLNQVTGLSLVGRRDNPRDSAKMETLSIDMAPVEDTQS